ncbi:hypothetical protein EX895_001581 [Sporisorium graminicola]|uniref:Major facilitator superfamily (MFS) profile domain-containing protein n=1 Tax=Sporisorium graminicola TaxID=280036 RepID=A0A4U7KX04_9BASI|nr:hypothetical protein EX895_001581 [Sporisorium graminicola]TKY89050.1 hypothetical protein EX895_001581 [Sporisorium graminicola]
MPPQGPTTAVTREPHGSNGGVGHSDDDADPERSPLLTLPRKETPLPIRSITILMLLRFAEPINFTIIFPFVNDMVYRLGATHDKAHVGFYAGIIESLFSVSQTCTILFWGSLSDRIGRKPVLLTGLAGVACSAVLFGLSRSFTWAVLARSMAGATNGNVAIVKSVMGELTDSTNQAKAFSLLPLTWTIGCLIGPLLGGYLSRPAEQYPNVFGADKWAGLGGLWVEFPYLLPCALSACITMCSITLGFFFLEETLPEIVERKSLQKLQLEGRANGGAGATGQGYGSTENRTALTAAIVPNGESTANRTEPSRRRQSHARRASSSSIRVQSWHSGYTPTDTPHRTPSPPASPTQPATSPEPHATTSVLDLLSIKQIQKVMISYAFLALIAIALDSVFVLYLYEPVSLGGVGFTSNSTGILLSINGLGGALVQLFLYPPLQKRLGTLRLYRLSFMAFPLSVVLMPLANVVARAGEGATGSDADWYTYVVWGCLVVSTAVRVVGGLAFVANMILVNQCSALTRATALGKLNSLAQMSSSCTRAVGPYFANILFAFSVTRNLLGGQLVWLILGVVGMIGPLVCMLIEDLEEQ